MCNQIDTMLIYLAAPYTHDDTKVRLSRVSKVKKATVKLFNSGFTVFSPISYTHQFEKLIAPRLRTHGFWMRQDIAVLRHCNVVAVLTLDGWELSRGVAEEIQLAKELHIPIVYLPDPDTYGEDYEKLLLTNQNKYDSLTTG